MAIIPQFLPVGISDPEFGTVLATGIIDVGKYTRRSVPVIRQQSDTSDVTGEHSLNPQGLWRRSQESWHHGAGQLLLDGKTDGTASDPERFRSSYGIDCWTKGQITLLHDTTVIRTVTPPTLRSMLTTGNIVYVGENQEVYWSNNPGAGASWTSAVINAGQTAGSPWSLATDSTHVWAALGTSGLHRTVVGAATSTADVPATACTLVGYALGRLLIANANVLYEVDDPLGTPSARVIMTHPNPAFEWTFILPGRNVIYAGGGLGGAVVETNWYVNFGGTGEVYKITLEPVGTQLGAPIQATYLPDGESIYGAQFYAGGVLLVTSRGFRTGTADGAGNIDYGPLITSTTPCVALEPQDRYAWSSSDTGGLRRFDLGFFVDQLIPAWADDLNHLTPADLADIAEDFPGDPTVFSVSHSAASLFSPPALVYTDGPGSGNVIRQAAGYVPSGSFTTGQIRFGTTDKKQARRLDLKHLALPAGSSITVEIAYDGGDFETIGASAGGTSTTIAILDEQHAEVFELRFTLERGAFTPQDTPTLLRWTLHALPIPTRNYVLSLPFIFRSVVDNGVGDGQPYSTNVPVLAATLGALERDSKIVTLQVGDDFYNGFILSSTFEGQNWSEDRPARSYAEGLYTIDFQSIDGWP